MSKRQRSVVILVVGVLLFLISAGADTLGLGGAPGFGWKQLTGFTVGVVLAAIGVTGLRAPR
jgi:hypothetical protein